MTRFLTITGTGSLFNYNMTQLSPFTENTIFIETVIIDDNITNMHSITVHLLQQLI